MQNNKSQNFKHPKLQKYQSINMYLPGGSFKVVEINGTGWSSGMLCSTVYERVYVVMNETNGNTVAKISSCLKYLISTIFIIGNISNFENFKSEIRNDWMEYIKKENYCNDQ